MNMQINRNLAGKVGRERSLSLIRPALLPVAGFQRRAGRKAPDAEASNVSPFPISVFLYLPMGGTLLIPPNPIDKPQGS